MARDCMAEGDMCGTCMQRHRTGTCGNTARPHCVSCGIAGHASWARECPTFICKCNEMNDRLEDNKLPYFPMDKAWTQVCEPPKVVYVVPPPPRVAHECQGRGKGTSQFQSTLPWRGTGPPGRGSPLLPQQNIGQVQNTQNQGVGNQAQPPNV